MSFPNIPNVEFKIIPEYKSGNREYAISSDGVIWIGKGDKWNKLKPFQIPQIGAWAGRGKWAVTLQLGGPLDGAICKTIDELLSESFGTDTFTT